MRGHLRPMLSRTKEVSWQRLRITAQMKAAVEQLDSLVLSFEEHASQIKASEWPETRSKAEVVEFFKKQIEDGTIPSELTPKDWTRFADNLHAAITSSKSCHRKKAPEFVKSALEFVSKRFVELSKKDHMPASLSLHQLVLGVLTEGQIIVPPLRSYTPFVNEELQSLFPATARLGDAFDMEL